MPLNHRQKIGLNLLLGTVQLLHQSLETKWSRDLYIHVLPRTILITHPFGKTKTLKHVWKTLLLSMWSYCQKKLRDRVLQNDVFHRWWSFHDVKLLTTSPYSSRTCLILNWIKFEKLQSIYPHFRAVSEKLIASPSQKSPSRLETMPRSEFFQFDTAVEFRGEAPEEAGGLIHVQSGMVGLDSCLIVKVQ